MVHGLAGSFCIFITVLCLLKGALYIIWCGVNRLGARAQMAADKEAFGLSRVHMY